MSGASTKAIEFSDNESKLAFRIGNAVLKRLIRSPLGARMAPLAVLEVTGRRSGRQVATPIGLHEVDGQHVLVAAGAWRHNFDGGHPVTLRRGSEVLAGTGTLVADVDRVTEVYGALLRQYEAEGGMARAGKMIGAKLPADRLPTDDELRTALAAGGRAVVELDVA